MSDGWVETNLGELGRFVNGYPFKPGDLSGSALPVIRIKQLLDPNAEVDFTDVVVPEKNRIDDGDLIFSWSGSLASRIWDRGPAALNQHLFRVEARQGVDLEFLHLLLDHAVEDLMTKTHGTTMKHVTKKVLESHSVALPPLAVQRRIVDLMAHLDTHITNLRTEMRSLCSLMDCRRRSLFATSTDHKRFASVAVLQRGFDLPVQSRMAGGIPVIASNGEVGFHDEAKVAGPGVVTGRSGTIGKVMFIEGDFWPLNTTLYVKDFKGNDPRFIRRLLESMNLPAHAGGSTVPSLNRNVLDDVAVFCPSISVQGAVAEELDSLESAATAAASEVDRLIEARRVLLRILLTGVLEVPASYDSLLSEVA